MYEVHIMNSSQGKHCLPSHVCQISEYRSQACPDKDPLVNLIIKRSTKVFQQSQSRISLQIDSTGFSFIDSNVRRQITNKFALYLYQISPSFGALEGPGSSLEFETLKRVSNADLASSLESRGSAASL